MENTSDDTEAAIMDATFEAVCNHGYASLTMQDIADEFDKSKSLLHYHYDTKEELFVAFLEHLLEQLSDNLTELIDQDNPPEDRIAEFIDWFAVDVDDSRGASFHLALLEMRSQAQHNPRFREQFIEGDILLREGFASLIEEGQEAGRFDASADPDAIARLSIAAMDGARARQLTVGEAGYAAAVGDALYTLVIDAILVES